MSDSAPSAAKTTVAPACVPEQTPADPKEEQALAWVGDAVLALWAREKVLREEGGLVTEVFLQLTGNAFLQTIGRPTQVEAEIGVVYRREGLAAAFAYIEARILPVYDSQAASRRRKAQARAHEQRGRR